METLKYKVISSDKQYDKYCRILEELVFSPSKTKAMNDEIDLLTLLIEKYDEEHNTFKVADPVELLKSLMKDHKMKAVDLARLLEVSEGLVSDILKYKKGFSKKSIRILSERFKMRQEAFSRPYQLILPDSKNRSKRKSKNKLAALS
jgi:HTH-type transcriptional regulator/antitoxin HigA